MVRDQVRIFFNVLIAGMIVAFIYDLFRIKRKAVKSSVIVIAIEDFLYWIIATIILFLSIYASNDGELRGFAVISYVTGALFYFLLLSRTVMFILVKVLKFLKKVITQVIRIIMFPVKKFIQLTSGPSKKLYNKTRDKTKEITKGITTGIKKGINKKLKRKHRKRSRKEMEYESVNIRGEGALTVEEPVNKKIVANGRIV